MALATNNNEKTMASDVIASRAEEPDDRKPPQQQPSGKAVERRGFFTIYKKGQGYWTRICTAGGVVLLLVFTLGFLWGQLPPWIQPMLSTKTATGTVLSPQAAKKAEDITLGVCIGFALLSSLLAWRIMNKPDNVDFLIATDSEMKKVNWTSKQELIGSTKVVIFFMLIIAIVLFLVDIFFGYLFYWLNVLKSPPF